MTESQHHFYEAADDEFVEFVRAGDRATGEFACVACGRRAVVHGPLPDCDTCSGELWERSSWSPFTGLRAAIRARAAR